MTQAVQTPITSYAPSGTTLGPFATVWTYADPAEVQVVIVDAEGDESVLTVTADYTLAATGGSSLSNGGGVSLLLSAVPGGEWDGQTLVLRRVTPASQPSSFVDVNGFRPSDLASAVDKLTRIVQELAARIAGAVRAPFGEAGHVLPSRATLKGALLYGDPATGALRALTTAAARFLFRGEPGQPGGVASLLAIAIDVAETTIPANMPMFRTRGYHEAGDGGSADYVRVAAEPVHPGKLRSSDRFLPDGTVSAGNGGWWELRETVINPVMFGAKADGATPCDAAFNAMSEYCIAVANVSEIRMAASARPADAEYQPDSYTFATGWTTRPSWVRLYDGSAQWGITPCVKINGHGTVVSLSAPGSSFIKWMPATQAEADDFINRTTVSIEGLNVIGAADGSEQYGVAIGAIYGLALRDCRISDVREGVHLRFALSTRLDNCQANSCSLRGFSISNGEEDTYNALNWIGGTGTNSASNVTVFDKCRVYGAPTQDCAFLIAGSDSCEVRNCIAEGAGGAVDLIFDYCGSTTVKLFTIDGMHFENPNVKCLMKVRATGIVRIRGFFYQYAAAILDASGGSVPMLYFRDIPWIPGLAWADDDNPQNWLFFHTDGGGYGGVAGGTSGSGATWDFEGATAALLLQYLKDAQKWENDTLPVSLRVRDNAPGDLGMTDYHTSSPRMETPSAAGWRFACPVNPDADNVHSLGRASALWSQLYAGTATISTSDERLKTAVAPLTNSQAQAGLALMREIGLYKFLAAIAEKGEAAARLHVGMTVQRAIEIMGAHDLDPFAYGFICHDTWGAVPAVMSTPGPGDDPETFEPVEVTPARAAGGLYSFRGEELALFMLAGLMAAIDGAGLLPAPGA